LSQAEHSLEIWALLKRFKGFELGTVITMGAAVLVIPGLLLILIYGYQRNVETSLKVLDEKIRRVKKTSIKMSELLIQPVGATLSLVAEVASNNPDLFRSENSRELLYQALISAQHIDAVYVSFEDGYHRVVTRIDTDRRQGDPQIPRNANWHASYLEAFVRGDPQIPRSRYRSYFDEWPNLVGQYEVKQKLDIRTLEHYKQSKAEGRLVVDKPTINPDTGGTVISLGFPIQQEGQHIGFVGANITLKTLSKFLEENRVSANSLTMIADRDGRLIIHPDPAKVLVRVGQGPKDVEFANLTDNSEARIREPARHHLETGEDSFSITTSNGEDLIAYFADFFPKASLQWELIVLVPTDDSIGPIRATNRAMIVLFGCLVALELLLIRFLSRSLAHGVEDVTRELSEIQGLSFTVNRRQSSSIKEIAELQKGVSLLNNALQTFSQYVPLGLVRQLVESRMPLGVGVESQEVTIFFSDLENFSTYAETVAPEELLQQVTAYFSAVTEAIAQEHGTVDKFIGDAVMAFWNAPVRREDHVLRACAGALRAKKNLDKLNQEWRDNGKPALRMRIGLNTATVLVGNIGSTERLSYTVMGDGVNVASRLEGVNKIFGSTICISDSVYEAVTDKVIARPLGYVTVKGRKNEFEVYELLGLRENADKRLMPDTSDFEKVDLAQRAASALAAGEKNTALKYYKEAARRFPEDSVAQNLLMQYLDE